MRPHVRINVVQGGIFVSITETIYWSKNELWHVGTSDQGMSFAILNSVDLN